ncbi:MAG: ABC transporter ATP-binding protein [Aquabacterium sp.]
MTMPVLSADIRQVRLSGQPVLTDVRLAVPQGRWTAVVGPNGAGKSTLLRALAGLQPVDGTVALQGRPMAMWPAKARAREVAWLGQGEAGADDLLAQDVVMLGRLPHQGWLAQPSAHDHELVAQAMQQTQSWPWRHRPMGHLSGGERQRVFLARALAVQAGVVLMDEPLSHLDPPHQADWIAIVRDLRQAGRTVMSVLHELNVALMADELVVMHQGRLVHQGPTDDERTRRAVQAVFEQRVRLVRVEGQWVALPALVQDQERA